MSSRRLVVLGFVTGALLGCTSESSSSGGEDGEPILTRDMEFGGIVEAADAVNATVYVSLDDGELLFGTEYVLTGGDVLDACVAGRCRRLVHDTNIIVDPLIPTGYENTLPYVPDADYVVSFSRGVGEAAPASVVTLPRPFEVTLPVAGQQFTDGESVAVAWSPSGTGESVYAWTDAKCDHEDGVVSVLARSRTRDLDRDGAVEIEIADTLAGLDSTLRKSPAPVTSCSIVVKVVHERRGSIDPAFGDGYLYGRVTRSVPVKYVPSSR